MKSNSTGSITAKGKGAGSEVDIANVANIIRDISKNGLTIEVEE